MNYLMDGQLCLKFGLSTLFLTIKWSKTPLETGQEFNIVVDQFIDKKKVDNTKSISITNLIVQAVCITSLLTYMIHMVISDAVTVIM